MTTTFRDRIRAGELLVGSFVKTPSPHVVEILGHAGLDFAVIDQEHAPIGLGQMDMLSLAGRSVGLPLLSRRWGRGTDWIAPLLDLGLTGVMVPHVLDAEGAEAVCDAIRFERNKRGLSPSPRAPGPLSVERLVCAPPPRPRGENLLIKTEKEFSQTIGELKLIAVVLSPRPRAARTATPRARVISCL